VIILKDDKLVIAGVIGALSTIPSEIVTQILVYFGVGEYSIYSISSMVVTINRPSLIIGLFVYPVMGAIIATLFYYALKGLGSNYIIIKSVMVGYLMWLALELFFTMYIEGKYIPMRPISDYNIHLTGAIIFGITQGILFKRYLF
jgi:uncharacterized membrane protein